MFEEGVPALQVGSIIVRGASPVAWNNRMKHAEALFRPDAASWETAIGAEADEVAAAAESSVNSPFNRISARVVHSSFEGNRWRVLAEDAPGRRLALFHHEPLASGTTGHLVVPVADTFLYPLPG